MCDTSMSSENCEKQSKQKYDKNLQTLEFVKK